METAARGSASIAYVQDGHGPGLVLVHGTGANASTTWSAVRPALAAERTLVLPDLRGSGGTQDDGSPLTLDGLAADVLAVVDDAGLERVDVCGFSLGGAVAVQLAATAPDRVGSLILIAAPLSGVDSRSVLQFSFWSELYTQDPRLFARYWLLAGMSPGFIAGIPREDLDRAASFPIEPGLVRQCALNTELDLTHALASIRASTLVIGGAHDTIVPPAETRKLAGSIPDARYLELDTGHMSILEAPARLVDVILAHLSGEDPSLRC